MMTGTIDPKRYGRMLVRLLPRAPRNDQDHDAMVAELAKLDELDAPAPEQKALANY